MERVTKEMKGLFLTELAPDMEFEKFNDSYEDIWVNGVATGLKLACMVIIGECGETTEKWLVEKIKAHLLK